MGKTPYSSAGTEPNGHIDNFRFLAECFPLDGEHSVGNFLSYNQEFMHVWMIALNVSTLCRAGGGAEIAISTLTAAMSVSSVDRHLASVDM
jgi:hypothetical protein